MRALNRYQWLVYIVLACLAAGIAEAGLFISAVRTSQPNWDMALWANRAGILTSLICTVSAFIGARQRRGIIELAVVVGVLGLVLTVGIEALSHSCVVCI